MRRLLATRHRLVRVRSIQLKAETLALAVARSRLDALQQHKAAIETLASSTEPNAYCSSGGTLAGAIELRGRLITASQLLSGRVGDERAIVGQQEARFLVADQNHKMAEKLLDRAARTADRAMERRQSGIGCRRPRRREIDQ